MIPRYKIEEIHNIWKTNNKLDTWLRVELSHLKALSENSSEKTLSKEDFEFIKSHVKIDVERWKEIEEETRHDLQAFVQMLEESVPDNKGRWIHFGLTSSDILDTSLTLMCRETLSVAIKYCVELQISVNQLLNRFSESIDSEILARTHGKAAEIQTYRKIFLRWSNSIKRCHSSLIKARQELIYGKMSGASGNNICNSYINESYALAQLGLKPAISTQIIPRDIYLDYFYAILKCVVLIEKIAYDVRMYSIDGINEMAEPFRKGQKGSSAMPHKKNPILTENICGLSRLYKSYFNTAIENCLTLFERDISHSAPERIIFKDAGHIICFIFSRLNTVISGLQIFPEHAELNVDRFKSLVTSQEEMNKEIIKGKSRKNSHDKEQSKRE